jgi:hypothetical protein
MLQFAYCYLLLSTFRVSVRKGNIIVKGNSIKISQLELMKVSTSGTPEFTSGAPEFILIFSWSVRISSDTIFSAEIQEYGSELKRQGSLGSWANTVAFSKMSAYPDHQTYWRRKARTNDPYSCISAENIVSELIRTLSRV